MIIKIVRSALTGALLAAAVLSIGCRSDSGSDHRTSGADATAASGVIKDSTIKKVHVALSVTKSDDDSLIIASVTQGSIPDSIVLEIDHVFQRIHVVLKNVSKDSLTASLRAPGEQRNVRINQIIMPDGRMDGPFGHELRYRTQQDGTYTLIIGKDNMADGQVEGPVTVYVKLL